MEFKKGDIVFHKNLRMVGTFVGYAWESKEEADWIWNNRRCLAKRCCALDYK